MENAVNRKGTFHIPNTEITSKSTNSIANELIHSLCTHYAVASSYLNKHKIHLYYFQLIPDYVPTVVPLKYFFYCTTFSRIALVTSNVLLYINGQRLLAFHHKMYNLKIITAMVLKRKNLH